MKIGQYAIWYRTQVEVPEALRRGKAFLEFDNLSTRANVYLNGKKVADHYGCYPFRVEVTGALGPQNQISLEIVHYPTNAAPILYEGYQYTYFDACAGVSNSYGGIGGQVRLVCTAKSYLEDLYVYTAAMSEGRAEIRLQAEVRNEESAEFAGEIRVNLRKWYPDEQPAEGRLVVPLKLAGRETKKLEEVFLLHEFDRWSLNEPNLYLAEVVLYDGVRNVAIDRVTQCLGLRTVENRVGDIYLNGERVFLAGTNLLMGYAADNSVCPRDESIAEDFLCLKKAGANVVRVHAATAYGRLAQVADQMGMLLLNKVYREWTEAIRSIDRKHIIFLEGNYYSQIFEGLNEPFDGNTVYSSHNYTPATHSARKYPGRVGAAYADRAWMEKIFLERNGWILNRDLPSWVGEFGALLDGPISAPTNADRARLEALKDQLDIFTRYEQHWTIWTYKDVGAQGLVVPKENCEYMKRIRPILEIKRMLGLDSWTSRQHGILMIEAAKVIEVVAEMVSSELKDYSLDYGMMLKDFGEHAIYGTIANMLTALYAAQFADMSPSEVEDMYRDAFGFSNCVKRQELISVLVEAMK